MSITNPPTPREGIIGSVTLINNIKVTKVIKVEKLMPVRVRNLIPPPNNRVDNPSRTSLLELINLIPIAEFVHYTHECPLLPHMSYICEADADASRGSQPIAPPPLPHALIFI